MKEPPGVTEEHSWGGRVSEPRRRRADYTEEGFNVTEFVSAAPFPHCLFRKPVECAVNPHPLDTLLSFGSHGLSTKPHSVA